MLKVLGTDSGCAAVFVCDVCGKTVDKDGIAASDRPEKGGYANVRHVHRGTCHEVLEAASHGRGGWTDMSDHVVQLAHNTGLPRPPGVLTLEERIAKLTGGYTL